MFMETVLITIVTLLTLGAMGYYRYKAVINMGKKMTSEYRNALQKSRDKH